MNSRTDTTFLPQLISKDVLIEKYARNGESHAHEVQRRVAAALAEAEPTSEQGQWTQCFFDAQRSGMIVGGRIASSAGTGLDATLINCFVQPIGDAISSSPNDPPGIFAALNEAAETMRRGGGVGYDFSSLRPAGSVVRSTQSTASGPVSYMQIFDRMCETVESAGARRGAQMGVLRCDHPDIARFIHAKDHGALSNFNLSVACTDAFMKAVQAGTQLELIHPARPGPAQIQAGANQREDGQWVYQCVAARDLFDQIMRSTYAHAEPGVIFIDTINRDNNLAWCETIASTNPCGEQPLPPYGCCDLGSINLTCFVVDAFSDEARFDTARFEALIPTAVRMLDNVLDVTVWPLPEQQSEAIAKRRIGLGFTGLGDTLVMLGLRFDTDSARRFAAEIAERLRNCAYQASVDLARIKGSFPIFDPEHYGAPGSAVSRLPDQLRSQIREHGIRNSHLLSIAPTGTISLAFADNASNGIEPAFSWVYERTKRGPRGQQKYRVEDHAWRMYRQYHGLGDDAVPVESAQADTGNENEVLLPDAFVSALHISARDHAAMSIAVQPFIDSAISKTVNVARDYDYEAFRDLYMQAWQGGLKGLSTFRPNAVIGSVLTPLNDGEPTKTQEIPLDLDMSGLDKRIQLDSVPGETIHSLRWPDRPEPANGNPAWTYRVSHPWGDFAVSIGHIEEPVADWPFEVWIHGAEAPRGLGALAKTLSMDMRSQDICWLDKKLTALEKAGGDDAFELRMPPNGDAVLVPSLAAGLARLIRFRCDQLGLFDHDSASHPGQLMQALIGQREPKAGPDGTMSWTVDVANPNSGDDFVLFVKELVMPGGQRRPYSIWLAGEYPRTLDGLCKALSIDMWVMDLTWIGTKLRKLLTYAEPGGEMRAKIPGSGGDSVWPSTIAWLAQLVLHRYQMLGLLDESGYVQATTRNLSATPDAMNKLLAGKRCSECGNRSVVRRDGCEFCTACGHLGVCG